MNCSFATENPSDTLNKLRATISLSFVGWALPTTCPTNAICRAGGQCPPYETINRGALKYVPLISLPINAGK